VSIDGQNNESNHNVLRIECGVFPLSPDARDYTVSIVNPEAGLQQVKLNNDDNGKCQQIIEVSSNIPETFAKKFSGNGEMDSVPLTDLLGDVPVASPVAILDSKFIADNTSNTSADNARIELSDKAGIDLAQGDPSDKGEHDSADEDDNDLAHKAKNRKADFEQRHDVAGNGE